MKRKFDSAYVIQVGLYVLHRNIQFTHLKQNKKQIDETNKQARKFADLIQHNMLVN